MPARVQLTWYHGSGPEEPETGAIIITCGLLMLSGHKKKHLKFLRSPPETPEPGLVRLKFSGDESCEVMFADTSAALGFQAQCLAIYEKNTRSSKALKPIDIPMRGSPQVERPAAAPSKASHPRSDTSGGVHDFELMSQQSHLPRSTFVSTPNAGDALAREAKRRHIDSHCTIINGSTPEKVGRMQSTPMRRAPPPRSSLLTMCPKKPAAPQGSSSYGGYRSSLTFGLRNLGNTCYLNAVMQACCSLREMVRDLREMPKTLPPSQEGALYRCTVEMLQQMSLASSGATGPLSPTKLREHVALAAPMFRGNEQQDAHEFFLEFVNQLHDELLAARNQWLGQRPEAAPEAPDDAAILATQLHLDSEVLKRLVCVQCQHVREVTERFRDFSLDFCGPAGGDRCSLPSMLRSYFDSELLEAKCECCDAVAAHMDKHLIAAPRVLVLHLKRFTPNLEKQRYDKQHQSVEIPARLDLKAILGATTAAALDGTPGRSPQRLPARPLAAAAAAAAAAGGVAAGQVGGADAAAGGEACATSPSRGPASTETDSGTPAPGTPGPLYNLRAVVAHDGSSPHSGHYTCYARGEDGSWRLYDDSVVREVPGGQELQRVLGRLAYIVFYVLQAPDAKA